MPTDSVGPRSINGGIVKGVMGTETSSALKAGRVAEMLPERPAYMLTVCDPIRIYSGEEQADATYHVHLCVKNDVFNEVFPDLDGPTVLDLALDTTVHAVKVQG